MQSQSGTTNRLWRRAKGLDEALQCLRERRWTVLAGGTDLYPGTERSALSGAVLDISALGALRGVAVESAGAAQTLRIGALATWSDLLRANLPAQFEALALAAREVGGVQIQNRGTVGGNLCNASPAADGTVALLALDAEVELSRVGAARTIPLAQFVRGVRRTDLREDELLVAVRAPVHARRTRSTFLKLGHRRYLVISIAMVAASATLDEQGHVARVAIAVGACAPTAVRLAVLEQRLLGMGAAELNARLATIVDGDALSPIAPIDDVRGTAGYRRDAVAELARRALKKVCSQ
ncbi:MAG: FAD binding domain-containing protein [Burkholderiaceae bacterium]|nr:FAD binding domain-containing protein [Burkholderiaceae bacterium]